MASVSQTGKLQRQDTGIVTNSTKKPLLNLFAQRMSTHNLDDFINMDPTKGLGQVMNLTQLVKTFYQQP
ncbi:hypothetical protein C0J52_13279 [Blattella germanica]|nr:hypothetical protein C0J52_13279 [Blattella germanica]